MKEKYILAQSMRILHNNTPYLQCVCTNKTQDTRNANAIEIQMLRKRSLIGY